MNRIAFALTFASAAAALTLLAAEPGPAGAPQDQSAPPISETKADAPPWLLETYGPIGYGGILEAEWSPFFATPVGPSAFWEAYSWGFIRLGDWFWRDWWGWPPNPSPLGWGYDSWYGGWYGWLPNGLPAGMCGRAPYLFDPTLFGVGTHGYAPSPSAYLDPRHFRLHSALGFDQNRPGPSGNHVGPRSDAAEKGRPAADPAVAPEPKPPKRRWFSRVPPNERIPMDGRAGRGGHDPWAGSRGGSGGGPSASPPTHRPAARPFSPTPPRRPTRAR